MQRLGEISAVEAFMGQLSSISDGFGQKYLDLSVNLVCLGFEKGLLEHVSASYADIHRNSINSQSSGCGHKKKEKKCNFIKSLKSPWYTALVF